uniref:Transcription antitermination protein NusB n=1 Tax=Candidatus Kentrum sp. TUN TaxID=2126343 RepID=A0A450ZY52_9GAMM|nr:MAG: NusB antitermination factor [Candidatus Kentron sp. TUN]VFK63301.1 MAG: NusB antitermination factor [Candidatus Kentron sp. TUN]VFK67461.1 MAG: NusB antitermination factor [Candidatus Kentron sp. TUN]
MIKTSRGRRTEARRATLQALYQWQITKLDPEYITFPEEWEFPAIDGDYFQELLREIPRCIEQLDARLTPVIDRPIHQIGPVERAILWIGAYELSYRPDVPWRVAVNEAVELAKAFGPEQSHKYINGVLDKMVANSGIASRIEDTSDSPQDTSDSST